MKTLLVTGATSGLGLEVAKFASKKHKVIACGRNTDVLQRLIKRHGCSAVQGNINDWTYGEPGTIPQILRGVEAHHADSFVCCAGEYQKSPWDRMSDAEIAGILNTNLVSTILLLKRVMDFMIKRGKGTIVVVNSLAGKNGNPNEAFYCASKFGLRGFVESVRHICAIKGVRICSIYPGAMRTPMTQHRTDYDKLLDPKSVAKLIVDICDGYTDMRLDDMEILRTTY